MLPAFAALGATSAVTQALTIREFLVICYGNELFIGLLLALWLAWIAVGAPIGGWLARRVRRPGRLWLGLVTLAAVLPPGQLLLVRLGRALVGVPPGVDVPFGGGLLVGALATAPFCLLVGVTFPLGVRAARGAAGDVQPVGRAFVAEAGGALAAGALFALVLVHWLQPLSVLALAAGAVGLGLFFARPRQPAAALTGAATAVALAAALAAAAGPLDAAAVRWRWQTIAPGFDLLFTSETPYQNAALSRQAEQFTLYLDGRPAVTFPDPYSVTPRVLSLVLQHPAPARALVVGGTTAGFVPALLQAGVGHVTVVEADRTLAEAVRPFLPAADRAAFSDPRVRTVFDDGRRFVRTTGERFDLLWLAAGTPATAGTNRYFTREFFGEARGALTPAGVLAFALPGAANVLGPELRALHGSLLAALRAEFPALVASPGVDTVYFASPARTGLSDDPAVLAARFATRPALRAVFSPHALEWLFAAPQIRAWWAAIDATPAPAVNADARPVSFYYGLLLWDREVAGARAAGSGLSAVLRAVGGLGPTPVALALLGLLGARLAWAWRRRDVAAARRFNSALAVGVTGFVAMGLEVLLLLVYQSLFGQLYVMVALMVALFMLGLALGAAVFTRRLPRLPRPGAWLFGGQLALAALALGLPALGGALPAGGPSLFGMPVGEWLFGGLLLAAGLVAGAQFPLAARLYAAAGPDATRTAARLDALDHVGAAAGAALVGGLWVPVLGTPATAGMLAALAAASALTWVLSPGPLLRGP